MIRTCTAADFETLFAVINDSASAYRGVIPADCWREPYLPREELAQALAAGVRFWGWEQAGALLGVMGLQERGDAALIRHAYVRTAARRRGLGRALLARLRAETDRPLLVGTWRDAAWAVAFYRANGFVPLSAAASRRLLDRYWAIPARQAEVSVVLCEPGGPFAGGA